MTFFHFLNCALLTFLPSFIIFKGIRLSGSLAFLIISGLVFLGCQFVKLLLLATLIPVSEDESVFTAFSIQNEILKVLIGGVDVVGVWFLYSRRLNRQTTLQSDERILGVGLGFATAESIVQRFLPLWINARGVEFNWSNIMTAIEANIQIPYYIAFATFVWLWSRTDLDKVSNPVVSAVLLTFAIIPVVFEYVHSTGLYDDVSMLVLRGALTAFATAVGALLVSRYKSLRDKQHHVKSN